MTRDYVVFVFACDCHLPPPHLFYGLCFSNGVGDIHDIIEWLEWQTQQFFLLFIPSKDCFIECSVKLIEKVDNNVKYFQLSDGIVSPLPVSADIWKHN